MLFPPSRLSWDQLEPMSVCHMASGRLGLFPRYLEIAMWKLILLTGEGLFQVIFYLRWYFGSGWFRCVLPCESYVAAMCDSSPGSISYVEKLFPTTFMYLQCYCTKLPLIYIKLAWHSTLNLIYLTTIIFLGNMCSILS